MKELFHAYLSRFVISVNEDKVTYLIPRRRIGSLGYAIIRALFEGRRVVISEEENSPFLLVVVHN